MLTIQTGQRVNSACVANAQLIRFGGRPHHAAHGEVRGRRRRFDRSGNSYLISTAVSDPWE